MVFDDDEGDVSDFDDYDDGIGDDAQVDIIGPTEGTSNTLVCVPLLRSTQTLYTLPTYTSESLFALAESVVVLPYRPLT